jgi:hypothetical protein
MKSSGDCSIASISAWFAFFVDRCNVGYSSRLTESRMSKHPDTIARLRQLRVLHAASELEFCEQALGKRDESRDSQWSEANSCPPHGRAARSLRDTSHAANA